MARSKKQLNKKTGGPYVAAAVFCDNVVRGEDGAMTVVRIVDHLTLTIPADAPEDVPSEDKRLPAQICALVSFKKGYASGKHEARFVTHSPSGKSQETGRHQIDFKGDVHGGANIRINFAIAVKEGGLFWTDVLLNGKLMTRMPLLITVKRAEAASPAREPAAKKRKKS